MNNMYINIGVNNGSEKGREKKHCGSYVRHPRCVLYNRLVMLVCGTYV